MMKHDRIWLQSEDDCHEVTWCQDKINDDDVEYIRLDLHLTALAVFCPEGFEKFFI